MEDLLQLLAIRQGHFRLESGHHGDLWLDLESLLLKPRRLRPFIEELAERISRLDGDAICGPFSGGAFLAQMVADRLDLQFYYSVRAMSARADTLYPVAYEIPIALREALVGKRVIIIDDVINAGSAVRATFAALRHCGAVPFAIATLMVLGSSAARFAADEHLVLESLGRRANTIWAPSECPLCAAGMPLSGVG